MKFVVSLYIILCLSAFTLKAQELGLEYEWLVENLGLKDLAQEDDEFITSLMRADIKTMRKFIDYGYNVNKKYENGITPLIYAVYSGDINVMKLLIKAGADVNTSANSLIINVAGIDKSEYTMAPILLSSVKGDLKMISLLLSHGADVEKKDNNEKTSLIWATLIGYSSVVDILLRAGANINYIAPSVTIGNVMYENVDALSISCIRNDFNTAQIILKSAPFTKEKYLECLMLTSNKNLKTLLLKLLKKSSVI